MICEPGKPGYPLPAVFYDVFAAPLLEIEGSRDRMGYSRPLMRLSPAEYDATRRDARALGADAPGKPEYYCTNMGMLFLHPVPDRAYVVIVRYFPQPKVW